LKRLIVTLHSEMKIANTQKSINRSVTYIRTSNRWYRIELSKQILNHISTISVKEFKLHFLRWGY